jgi:hypothetical protein
MRFRGLTLALLGWACARPGSSTDCPRSYHQDAERTAHLVALLRQNPETSPLALHQPLAVCYARGAEPGITTEAIVLLDSSSDEPSSAARLAHLLVHLEEGLRPDRAVSEERARAVEDRVRRAWGLPSLSRSSEPNRAGSGR